MLFFNVLNETKTFLNDRSEQYLREMEFCAMNIFNKELNFEIQFQNSF